MILWKSGDGGGEACEVQSGEFEMGRVAHGTFSDSRVIVCDAAGEGRLLRDHDEFVLEHDVQDWEGGEYHRWEWSWRWCDARVGCGAASLGWCVSDFHHEGDAVEI